MKMMGLWKQMRLSMKSNEQGRVPTFSTGQLRRQGTTLRKRGKAMRECMNPENAKNYFK